MTHDAFAAILIRRPRVLGLPALLLAQSLACTSAPPADEDDGSSGAVDSSGTQAESSGGGGTTTAGIDDGESGSGTTEPTGATVSLLERIVESLGGRDRFNAMATVQITETGSRWFADEGISPRDASAPGSDFSETLTIDIEAAGMRLDVERTITFEALGLPQTFSEVISGQHGYVDGTDNLFGAPGGPMPSDRLTSVVRQQRLLNPHLLVKEATIDPSIATELGSREYDGIMYEVLQIDDAVSPIDLWFDPAEGVVARLTTLENNWLHRDVELDVRYEQWQPDADGISFPHHVSLAVGAQQVLDETRTDVATNVELAPDTFAIPADMSIPFVDDDGRRGERNHQWLQGFHGAGLLTPLTGLQNTVEATELASGVWHLTGALHHSLVVEQSDRVILLETPLREARCVALLDWIDANIPGKPVTHAIVSHFHIDHAACARTLAARGATLVLGSGAETLWDEVFDAPSTIEPDELAANPNVVPSVEFVQSGDSLQLDDAVNPITAYPIATEHAVGMMMVFLDSQGILFESDLFTPGASAEFVPEGPQELLNAIEARGLLGAVTLIAGGHGFGTGTIADVQSHVP